MKKLLLFNLLLLGYSYLLSQSDQSFHSLIQQKYWKISDSLANIRQFDIALNKEQGCLSFLRKNENSDHYLIATSLKRIGIRYRQLGDLKNCKKYYEKAVQYAQKHAPTNEELIAGLYNSIGIINLFEENYTTSEIYFKQSLEIREKNNSLAQEESLSNLGLLNQYIDKYDLALEYYLEALNFCRKYASPKAVLFKDKYQNIGTIFHLKGEIDDALMYYDSAVWVMKDTFKANHADYGGIYNNMALAFVEKGDFRSAKDYYRKAIENYTQNLSGDQRNLAKIYSNFGLYLFENADYNRALVYFHKSLDLRKQVFKENHSQIARSMNYIGNAYLQKNDLDKAEKWLMDALKIRKKNGRNSPADLADSYQDVGHFYEKSGYWKRALEEYQKAIRLNISTLTESHPIVGENYFRVGMVYLNQKKYPEAQKWLSKSLKIYRDKFGETHPKTAENYAKLAMSFPNNEARSNDFLNSALNSIGYNKNASFQSVSSPKTLLEILKTKSELALDFAIQNDDLKKLESAAKNDELAIQLIDSIKISFQDPGSRQALLDNFYKVYENAIEANFNLKQKTNDQKYWERAFEIAEKSNSTLLIEALNTLDAEAFAGIPERLLSKERKLKLDIGFREKLRFEEEQKGSKADREKIKIWNDELFDLKHQHQEVIQIFVDSFPQYYELKYADRVVSVEMLQQEVLKENQVMLEYFVGDEKIFLFVISKTDFEVIPIEKDFPFEIWVEELRTGIYFYHPARPDAKFLVQKYANIANELYEILVKPAEGLIAEKDLVIVPGGILGYLPFEALLTTPTSPETSFKDFPYLLRNHAISYNYSAILWYNLNQHNHEHASQNFLGFAPWFSGNVAVATREGTLGKLHYNETEVQRIQEMFGGEIFTDSLATVDNFLQNAHLFRILHLATHGIANDQIGDYSYLAFYQIPDSIGQDLLYVKDIYNLKLRAEMVALSACETAVGEYQRGEGIVSLARGFFYAGAESILTTLWKLDDKASLDLMESFYENYKNGLPKDQSLRQAKLAYIEGKENFHAHPLYWAAFVPVGDMSAFEGTVGIGIWGWLLIGILILGMGYFILKFRK